MHELQTGPSQSFSKMSSIKRIFKLELSPSPNDYKLSFGFKIIVLTIGFLLTLPIGAIITVAFTKTNNDWPHLLHYVLPHTALQTGLLSLGVGLISLVTGTITAWFVTMYRFRGRVLIDRLLVLPLAIPTYIVAYCYVELLDYGGALQSFVRKIGGFKTARDYYFPEIHSLGGAVLILSFVLYPYIYLAARASFVQQSICVLEVARTLGQTSFGAFWRIALPLARPALIAGFSLVLMETLNDLGAVQYLGVDTISVSIYTTWLQRSNLSGAVQICLMVLLVILFLLTLEKIGRGASRFDHTTGRYRSIPFQDIDGLKGFLVALFCVFPFILGFLIPFIVLLKHSIMHMEEVLSEESYKAVINSMTLASLVAFISLFVALFLGYAKKSASSILIKIVVRIASLGYALPGIVLAIGVLVPLTWFDNWIDSIFRVLFAKSTGLFFSGTLLVLIFALVVRFLTIAFGNIESGFERISPSLEAAARSLGETSFSSFYRIELPLLIPALGAGILIVFVDTIKELPATLLLRPFNFETLATQVYALTSLEQFEKAAFSALLIVVVGLLPIILLHQTVAGGRAGTKRRMRVMREDAYLTPVEQGA